MRLRRLDLTRYGKFTDFSLDFGAAEAGRPDLHLVYGANEAGKSTALAGFLDLLFRIEPRSRFNFVHAYPAMRVGAALEFAGTVHELIRVKRTQNDLLDGNEQPVPEAIIAGQLGGIGREAYRAMFSLDDDTLEAGGESILASKGDLGEMLFSASTGLAELSRTLAGLREEADGFYRFHAHGGQLAELKTRLAALREARDQLDTVASRYAQLVEVRDQAQKQYEEALARRTEVQSRMEAIQRYVGALPRLAALRAIRAQLPPLADLPAAPVGWIEAVPKLRQDEIELEVRADALAADVARRSAEREAIVVDAAALQLADRVDRLGDLHARYVTAEKDIPDRRLQVQQEALAITGLLGRIGRVGEADPRRLVLAAATVGALRELIEQHSGVQAAIRSATNELSGARQRLEEAQARLQDAAPGSGGVPEDAGALATLAAVLAALRGDDHAARRRLATRSSHVLRDELTDRLLALQPWQGDADRLAASLVPEPGELQRWEGALAAAQAEHDRTRHELGLLATEQTRLTAERDAIARVEGVVTDQDAGRARAEREASWSGHRRTLDAATADIFEAALRRDDLIVDARLRHEADVARLNHISRQLALNEAECRRVQEKLAAVAAGLRGIQDEIAAAVTRLLPAGATLVQFEAWLEKRGKALETRAALKQAEHDLRAAEADSETARGKLARALTAAGVPHAAGLEVDELRAVAQAALDRETELKALRAGVKDRAREVARRERNLEHASEAERNWHAAWAKACAGCWLGEAGAPPALATVRETLAAVAELGPALDRRDALADRIEKMLQDQSAFAAEVADIGLALGFAPDSAAPLALAQRIADRVAAARAAVDMRATRTRELEQAQERQRELVEAREVLARRKAEMTAFFGVASLTEVAGKLADIARKNDLTGLAEAATGEILDALRLASIAAAETVLDQADRTALEAELGELQARFEDQDRRTRELFSAHSKAADQVEAVGGDAAVAKLEEQRRTVLLEIEDGAVRYLRLRVGIAAAEHALRSYRQQHRSSMMARASEAFRTISRDAYRSLASQPDRDSEKLIAVAADGSSKIASELSKGTRFQLYLALRVAGYHEFAKVRPTVPFIADDIMETFDDFRAEEALRLLGTMAEVGQVIYLTHHRHLCEIAQRTCPGVRVHELAPVMR